jgi:hypothetical protein
LIKQWFMGMSKLAKMYNIAWEHLQQLSSTSLQIPRGSLAKDIQKSLPPFPAGHRWDAKDQPMVTEPGSAGGSSGSGSGDNEPQNPQLADDSTLHRAEEAAFRDWLNTWTEQDLTFVPEDHAEDWKLMMSMMEEYISNFSTMEFHELMRSEKFPTSLRVWTSATVFALYEIGRRNLFPRFITMPSDIKVRAFANNAPAGYQDPGNITLDMFFHATVFWKLCDVKVAQQVLQVHGSYGTNTNKSSHGPVNFRGNIIEALLGHLQSICSKPTTPSESGHHSRFRNKASGKHANEAYQPQ